MRTRLIRPAFFTDELMAQLSISTRLVYIGLWTLTDDAGFLDDSVREIAVELFPFDTPRRREARISRAIDDLVDLHDLDGKPAPRVVRLDCGDHLLIPTIPDHRTQGGEKVYTIQKRHESRCLARRRRTTAAPTSEATAGYVSDSVSESDSVSVSINAQARPRELREAARKAGGFVGDLEARRRPNGEAGA